MTHSPDDAPAEEPAGDPVEEVDALGLLCPLPVLKLRKRLRALPPGGLIRLIADDPAAEIDVPHFCAESGCALLAREDRGEGARGWLLRKPGAA